MPWVAGEMTGVPAGQKENLRLRTDILRSEALGYPEDLGGTYRKVVPSAELAQANPQDLV